MQVQLQEIVVGFRLHANQVRRIYDGLEFSEVRSLDHPTPRQVSIAYCAAPGSGPAPTFAPAALTVIALNKTI
jgi:hypothetical protein